MERKQVSSTNIHSVGYDPAALILEVEFKNSGIYQYHGVPEKHYLAFMQASSKGRYLNDNIKDRYPYKKLF